jgi:hypothetical protein
MEFAALETVRAAVEARLAESEGLGCSQRHLLERAARLHERSAETHERSATRLLAAERLLAERPVPAPGRRPPERESWAPRLALFVAGSDQPPRPGPFSRSGRSAR